MSLEQRALGLGCMRMSYGGRPVGDKEVELNEILFRPTRQEL